MKLLKETLNIYDMSLPQFAKKINFPKSTIQGWIDKKSIPRYGTIMLESLMKIKKYEEKDKAVKRVFELYQPE